MSDEDITLREHLAGIASKGGKARLQKMTARQRSAVGKKGGKVGGKAAAAAMTPEERKARAQKAAAKSAEVRKKNAEERKRQAVRPEGAHPHWPAICSCPLCVPEKLR